MFIDVEFVGSVLDGKMPREVCENLLYMLIFLRKRVFLYKKVLVVELEAWRAFPITIRWI